MNREAFAKLALLTIQRPQEAAVQVLSLGLGRDVLWTGLFLVAAINSIMFSMTLQVTGKPPMLPDFFVNPLAFFVIFAGMLVLTVHAFYWTGRSMGGQGDLGELLALTVWLQALRAIAQAGGLLLVVALPYLAPVYSLAVGILGFWIMLTFISTALRLHSLLTAFAVIMVAALGLSLGIFVFGAMIEILAMGVAPNV